MKKNPNLQVLSVHRQLHPLSHWARSHLSQKGLPISVLTEALGVTVSTVHVKLHKGLNYLDAEKIAEYLKVPKPNLAQATLYTLQKEIRDISGTPLARELGMEVEPVSPEEV